MREKIYQVLQGLDIHFEVDEHPAVFTIEEMENLGIHLRGEVCKNLFLRDAKGKKHFLVVLKNDKKINLKNLARFLQCSKLSFASEERLFRFLGLQKGAVSPLGVINDTMHAVIVLLDDEFVHCERLGVHPCDNTATLWISFDNLCRFIDKCGEKWRLISLKNINNITE